LTELRKRAAPKRAFVLGFCMGGRVAFNASAEQDGLAGVVGFYGVTRRRDADDKDAPIDKVARMRAPVLGLFGGADGGIPAEDNATFDKALDDRKLPHHLVTYPGAPHSFFDRKAEEFADASAAAWREILAFIRAHTA
jgi:carboxymethylenebutenolidase